MKFFFSLILVLHGLIHLLGFLKAFQFTEMAPLQSAISKPMGVLWAIVTMLFLLAAVMLFISDYWFIPATAAVFMSSGLLISSWSDARYGMIPNLLILAVCGLAIASVSYKSVYRQDVKVAAASSRMDTSLLTEADIQHLPVPVQNYIRLSGSIGKPKVQHFKAEFDGKIRKDEQSEWMPFTCEQHNFMAVPSRLFFMDARMKGLPVAGYHHYKNGTAVMDIRLLSLLRVQYAEGNEMDVSETVTFFNDMCCMAPATLIDSRIQWLETNGNQVMCSFTHNQITIRATLIFNGKHQLVNFISNDRYAYTDKGPMARVPWQTPIKAYKPVNGYYLAASADMIYNYPEGDLNYGEFKLNEIKYN